MKQKDLLKLLDNIKEQGEETTQEQRILLIDGLNLFFRNFAILNMVNSEGMHIGGLGGFLRSLGGLIRQTQPTKVFVVFDGIGSSNNRKNIIPEYKSERKTRRITNWEIFENLEEEEDSQVNQITRIIQYLKILPVKTLSIDKVEADDVIAYLSNILSKKSKDKIFIVSADMDFIQLVDKNIVVYNPRNKEYYTPNIVREKFGMFPYNFILYKTLLGDSSDNIKGIKGLGKKGIIKKFPELTESKLTLDDIFDICKTKFKDHVIYSRIIHSYEELEKSYRVMDLSNPMLDEKEKKYLQQIVNSKDLNYFPEQFMVMHDEDQLGNIVKNADFWLQDVFKDLIIKN